MRAWTRSRRMGMHVGEDWWAGEDWGDERRNPKKEKRAPPLLPPCPSCQGVLSLVDLGILQIPLVLLLRPVARDAVLVNLSARVERRRGDGGDQ
eukprot:19609-Pyramimonas_sp.AAC.1